MEMFNPGKITADMKAFSLEGKIAWITGASYGIGFAIAEAYAAAGATIVFNDINQELVDKGLAAYKEKGIPADYLPLCDVAVKVPLFGAVESLNVSVAASILLYEVKRQRNLL